MGVIASPEELAVRRAVRAALHDLPAATVLVACSGGADSLALACAVAFEARRAGRPAGAVTIDHGLQDGSPARAREVGVTLIRLGFDPVEVIHVPVVRGRSGPEGDARRARYAALDAAAERYDASAVLLGHTRDDQAETVLLGLARGSGARSLAGMAPAVGRYRRPLLTLDRATVRAAVPADVTPWDDPHNADRAYLRAIVRHDVLPVLDKALGPGVSEALGRTAELLRADADALDAWAERAHAEAAERATPPAGSHAVERASVEHSAGAGELRAAGRATAEQRLDVGALADLPAAVRTRVLRRAALAAGCPRSELTAAHVWAVQALVSDWHGQGPIDLPGKVRAARSGRPATIAFGSTRTSA